MSQISKTNENINDIFSVSSYLDRLNSTLKTERAKISGEISSLQMYEGRSYLYFSLKDSRDQSTVKCFMWKNDYKLSGLDLKDGLEVIVTAYPNIYKPNGGLTLQVDLVELVGEGALKIAYDKLKIKLAGEGLFEESKKRQIPNYPHRIGVITSKSGAVINDFLTNIGKYGFEILFVDSKVEGQDAVKDILASISTLKSKDVDVLVLMRGGGSLESFLAFNNEAVVRAIADFPKPTITGIGHDKDAPLVSFVSDKNVSTPTAVAHILNESWDEATSVVRSGEEKIFSTFSGLLSEKGFIIEHSYISIEKHFDSLLGIFKRSEASLHHALDIIKSKIGYISEDISRVNNDLMKNFEMFIRQVNENILNSEKTIGYANPERQLSRGYSIVKSRGKIIRRVQDVNEGDKLDIVLSDGKIQSQVI